MAVLNKIRQRSLFLILIIALALFSFVLSDLFQNSAAFGGASQDTVATVNGTEIHRDEFMSKVENAQRQMGPSSSSTQTMNRVWDQELRKILVEEQIEKLGLSVEKDHMRDLLKNSFASFPEFMNEAGTFDENKLNSFIANLKAISPARAPLGNFEINYAEWVANEAAIAVGAQEQMYYNLIKAGLVTTVSEAEAAYALENATVDLKYVQVPYSTIDDSTVEVSKSDISNYINAHKAKFQTEASRDISVAIFKEDASIEDEAAVKESLAALMNDRVEFNETTKRNDSIIGFEHTKDAGAYVNLYSDIKFDENYISKSQLPSDVSSKIFDLPVGEYYGPYKDNGMYKITKVVSEKFLPDSVKSRHILIPFLGSRAADESTVQTEEAAKVTADSLLAIVKGNRSKFVDLLDFSIDKVSNENEGVIDWYTYNSMVEEYRDYTFENNTGDLAVIKTDFGFHVVEILGQKDKSRKIRVATLAHKIEASEATVDAVFNKTSNFEIAIQSKKDFQESAKAIDVEAKTVNGIKELDENIPALGNQRSIVRWAFEKGTKVGDSKRFSIPNVGYAVVQIAAVSDKGLMSTESASAVVIPEVRKEKKAKLIREKVKGKSFEEVAKSEGASSSTAMAVNLKNPTLSGAGVEPKVIGAAFGLKDGATSNLIDGKNGVYMVQVTNRNAAQKLDNYQPIMNRLSNERGDVQSKVFNALKASAKIDDNRATFY